MPLARLSGKTGLSDDQSPQYPGVITRIVSVPDGFDASRYSRVATSVDVKGMAFECVAATERRVVVWDSIRGQLVEEILIARGGIFLPQVPLLDSHQLRGISNVLGAVSGFRRDESIWLGRASLTPGVDVCEDAFKRVAAGHLTDLSVGYTQLRSTIIGAGQTAKVEGLTYTASRDIPLMVTTRWSVHEVSLCAIGADSEAKIRGARELQDVTDLSKPRRRLRFAGEPIGVFR